jgi:hypothetical protein
VINYILIVVAKKAIIFNVTVKHKKILRAIFFHPTLANIKFSDIESLVKALGGEVREGSGSRVVLVISGKREYAHRPHPGKEAKRYVVEKIRQWLISLEVTP